MNAPDRTPPPRRSRLPRWSRRCSCGSRSPCTTRTSPARTRSPSLTSSVGNEMHPGAEVKLRGVVVGEVRAISADGERREARPSPSSPGKRGHIPSDVRAQMLPTTLFGERFVALVPPPNPSTRALSAGATIPQDRSRNAIELEQVLDNVLPMLTAVKPDKLSSTLSAVAQALRGRGTQLGDTFVTLDAHLKKFNPDLPTLNADLMRARQGHPDLQRRRPRHPESAHGRDDHHRHPRRPADPTPRRLRPDDEDRPGPHGLPPAEQGQHHPAQRGEPTHPGAPRQVLAVLPLHPAHPGRVRPRDGQGARQGHRSARTPRHRQSRALARQVRARPRHPRVHRERRPALLPGAVPRRPAPRRERSHETRPAAPPTPGSACRTRRRRTSW